MLKPERPPCPLLVTAQHCMGTPASPLIWNEDGGQEEKLQPETLGGRSGHSATPRMLGLPHDAAALAPIPPVHLPTGRAQAKPRHLPKPRFPHELWQEFSEMMNVCETRCQYLMC